MYAAIPIALSPMAMVTPDRLTRHSTTVRARYTRNASRLLTTHEIHPMTPPDAGAGAARLRPTQSGAFRTRNGSQWSDPRAERSTPTALRGCGHHHANPTRSGRRRPGGVDPTA